MSTTQRRVLLVVLGAAAGLVLAVSAAYACANLTTLKLDTDSAAVGSTVTGKGDRFRSGDENTVSDVVVTLERRDGQVLWRGRAGEDRTVNVSFEVPDVKPGYYMIIATQYFADGRPVSGAPARTNLRITAAPAQAQGTVSASSVPAGEPESAAAEPATASEAGSSAASGSSPAATSDERVSAASTAASEQAAAGSGSATVASTAAASDDREVTTTAAAAPAEAATTARVAPPPQLLALLAAEERAAAAAAAPDREVPATRPAQTRVALSPPQPAVPLRSDGPMPAGGVIGMAAVAAGAGLLVARRRLDRVTRPLLTP